MYEYVDWHQFLNGLRATVIEVRTCPTCNYMVISAIQAEPVDYSFKPIMFAQDLSPNQPCHICN